jgi:hypothetical protein
MCFVKCKKKKKLSKEEQRQQKIDSQKALSGIYSKIMNKNFQYIGK